MPLALLHCFAASVIRMVLRYPGFAGHRLRNAARCYAQDDMRGDIAARCLNRRSNSGGGENFVTIQSKERDELTGRDRALGFEKTQL